MTITAGRKGRASQGSRGTEGKLIRAAVSGSTTLRGPRFDRTNLGHQVANVIRTGIMNGTFTAGRRMGTQELAARLGVSTQPVREALVTLANEGLLDALPRRGYHVTRLRRRDIEDVFAVHAFLAGVLAEGAAIAADDSDIARLTEIQSRILSTARDTNPNERESRLESLNHSFHRTINLIPDASRLRLFLRGATRYVPRDLYRGWLDSTVGEHPAILDALARRDSDAARRLTEEHVKAAGAVVVARMEAMGFWE